MTAAPDESYKSEWLSSLPDGAIEGKVRDFAAADGSAAAPPGSIDQLSKYVRNVLAGVPAGDQYGPYRITGMLGRGGMGVVHRARHIDTGGEVALKTAQLGTDLADALRHEAATVGRVLHPNIVRVHATGEDNGFFWVAFDLVEGKSLKSLIDEAPRTDGRMPVRKLGHGEARMIVGWFADLARALDELHEAGYVHRDIKPANIMIRKNSVAYLIDFGLAFDEDTDDPVGKVLAGTAPYMSPEQWMNGILSFDRRSDVYSLCASLFEALVGNRVAEGRLPAQVTLHDAPPRPSSVSPYVPLLLDGIVLKGLAKRADDRFGSAGVLADELDRAREKMGTIRGLTRRGRMLAMAVGFVVVTAVAVAGVAYSVRSAEQRDHEAALASLEQEIARRADAGDFQGALKLVRQAPPAFHDDAQFRLLHESVVFRAGSKFLQDAMAAQVFSSAFESEDAALFHLQALGWKSEPMALLAGFLALIDNRPKKTLTTLDQLARADGHSESPPVARLRALALFSDSRPDEAKSVLSRVPKIQDRHASREESYLFVLTNVWHHKDIPVDLELAAREADALVLDEHENGLGLTLHGQVRFDQGRYAEAFDDWNRLFAREPPPNRAQAAGIHVKCGQAAILASEGPAEARDEWLKTATDNLVKAEYRASGAAAPLLGGVSLVKHPMTVAQTLESVLAPGGSEKPSDLRRHIGEGLALLTGTWLSMKRPEPVLQLWDMLANKIPELTVPPDLVIDNAFFFGEAAWMAGRDPFSGLPAAKTLAHTWALACKGAAADAAESDLNRFEGGCYAALLSAMLGDAAPAQSLYSNWKEHAKDVEALIAAWIKNKTQSEEQIANLRATVDGLKDHLEKVLAPESR